MASAEVTLEELATADATPGQSPPEKGEPLSRGWSIIRRPSVYTAVGLRPTLALFKRVPWALVSTATSSVGSLMLSLSILRSATTVTFAYFGIAFTFYALVLNLSRAVTGSPMILLFSGRDDSVQRRAAQSATLNSVALGILAIAAAAGPITLAHGHAGLLFAGVAFMPGLLAQDALRYAYFTKRSPRGAAVADMLWTGSQGALFFLLFALGDARPVPLVLAWGGAGTFAACAMALVNRMRFAPREALAALVTQRRTIAPLVGEMGVLGSADFLIALTIASVGGTAILGDYRAGAVLAAPFNVFMASIIVTVVPAGVAKRLAGASTSGTLRRAAIAVIGFTAAIGLVGAVLPATAGRMAFGPHWPSMRALLFPWLFAMSAIGLSTLAFAALRIAARLNTAMVIRAASLPVILGFVASGTALDGARGAILGYGLAAALSGFAVLYVLRTRPDQAHK